MNSEQRFDLMKDGGNLRDLKVPENPDATFVIDGPSKQLTVQLETDGREVLMQDTIIKQPNVDGENRKVQNETTALYLKAAKIALETAQRHNVSYRWIFNPTDPEGKMAAWHRAHVDSEEPDELKSEVTAEDVTAELDRVSRLLDQPNFNSIPMAVKAVENPKAHEQELCRRVDEIRKAI